MTGAPTFLPQLTKDQANIFVDHTGKCVIADVGMAHLTEMAEFIVMKNATTCRWTAPELMDATLPPPTTEGPFWTMQSDVFAYAITVVEVRVPAHTETVPILINSLFEPDIL